MRVELCFSILCSIALQASTDLNGVHCSDLKLGPESVSVDLLVINENGILLRDFRVASVLEGTRPAAHVKWAGSCITGLVEHLTYEFEIRRNSEVVVPGVKRSTRFSLAVSKDRREYVVQVRLKIEFPPEFLYGNLHQMCGQVSKAAVSTRGLSWAEIAASDREGQPFYQTAVVDRNGAFCFKGARDNGRFVVNVFSDGELLASDHFNFSWREFGDPRLHQIRPFIKSYYSKPTITWRYLNFKLEIQTQRP